MTQRLLTERQQRDLHPGRIPPRQDRQVRALEMRRRADRGQDVGGQRQVQHLLLDDIDQRGLPRLHPRELLRGETLAGGALERELRVQVLAHQAMLDLAGLAEQVDKLFPALHLQRRLGGHRGLPSRPSRACQQEAGCNAPDSTLSMPGSLAAVVTGAQLPLAGNHQLLSQQMPQPRAPSAAHITSFPAWAAHAPSGSCTRSVEPHQRPGPGSGGYSAGGAIR